VLDCCAALVQKILAETDGIMVARNDLNESAERKGLMAQR
jgi:pyruvate kinase